MTLIDKEKLLDEIEKKYKLFKGEQYIDPYDFYELVEKQVEVKSEAKKIKKDRKEN